MTTPVDSLVRPAVLRIEGYVPGEQPQGGGWVKLNTNENPYPPSPAIKGAIDAAAERLQIYPDPLGRAFRQAAADVYGVDPEWILPANGSDENLTILMRTFADPQDTIGYPYPSYILYETLADIQGAAHVRLPLRADWEWDLESTRLLRERCKLLFVPNPNSPSGNLWSDETIEALVPPRGVLVLDGAYCDFAESDSEIGILDGPVGRRVVITRTLSKSYSLAGLRFGFAIAHPDLISQMRKVKDSYNCDSLSLAAAEAAVRDQDWMQENVRKIRATRTRLDGELVRLGFEVIPSQANFVWARHASSRHREIYQSLKDRKVLVRYMVFPGWQESADSPPFDGLRITVGTDEQIDRFLEILAEVLAQLGL